MNDETDAHRSGTPISWHVIAIIIACIGLIFMLYVAVNTVIRYGLTWNFDLAQNDHIGTFIASIAGTLFGLTNALLLFETLKTQRQANAQQAKQHGELIQAREYERFTTRLDRIEADIKDFRIELPQEVVVVQRSLSGLSAWEELFQQWVNASFESSIVAALELEGRIDPSCFLPHQEHALDVIVRLDRLIVDGKRLLTNSIDQTYLIDKAERWQNQLARFRPQLQTVTGTLWGIVNGSGIQGYSKNRYASDLMHVIEDLKRMINALPAVAYRVLTPMAKHVARFGPNNAVKRYTAEEVPTVQIDLIAFHSKDPKWFPRIDQTRLKVTIEAFDAMGRSLSYQHQYFGLSMLIDARIKQDPEFDTKGRWRTEGQFNPMAQLEQHETWNVTIECEGLKLNANEDLELTLFTDAVPDIA